MVPWTIEAVNLPNVALLFYIVSILVKDQYNLNTN